MWYEEYLEKKGLEELVELKINTDEFESKFPLDLDDPEDVMARAFDDTLKEIILRKKLERL